MTRSSTLFLPPLWRSLLFQILFPFSINHVIPIKAIITHVFPVEWIASGSSSSLFDFFPPIPRRPLFPGPFLFLGFAYVYVFVLGGCTKMCGTCCKSCSCDCAPSWQYSIVGVLRFVALVLSFLAVLTNLSLFTIHGGCTNHSNLREMRCKYKGERGKERDDEGEGGESCLRRLSSAM